MELVIVLTSIVVAGALTSALLVRGVSADAGSRPTQDAGYPRGS